MVVIYVLLTVLFTGLSILIVVGLVVVSVLRSYLKIEDLTPETIKTKLSFDGVPKQLEHFMFHGASNGTSGTSSSD